MSNHSTGILVFVIMMLIMYLRKGGEKYKKKAEAHAKFLESQRTEVPIERIQPDCSDEDYLSELWLLGESADVIDTPWRHE